MAAAGGEPSSEMGGHEHMLAPSSEVSAAVPPHEPDRRRWELMSLDRAWSIKKNPGQVFGYTTHNDAESAHLRSRNEGGEAGMPQIYFMEDFSTLKQLFGEPLDRTSRDVTTEWIVAFGPEEVAHIYDWQATNRYEKGNPSVEEQRSLEDVWWHMSARDEALIGRMLDIIKVQWTEAKFVRSGP